MVCQTAFRRKHKRPRRGYSKPPAELVVLTFGLLDNRRHTSNGQGFLEMFSPTYKGQSFYIDEPSVADNNRITANPTGSLVWANKLLSV